METLPSVKTESKYKDRVVEIHSHEDIPSIWRQTPIEQLIMSQNFGWPVHSKGVPELLICTCIEFRYALPIPRMYAYVIRRASGRVVGSEFTVGYILAKGIEHMVIIGHNDCGMVKVNESLPRVVDAFVNQGWHRNVAEEYCKRQAVRHAIKDEIDALEEEYKRLTGIFRKLVIAPLFVSLYDSKFYIPKWYLESLEHSKPLSSYTVPDEEIFKLG